MDAALPDDVVDLIWRHRAAAVIRRWWLRYDLYAHVHNPMWREVKCRMVAQGVWPDLWLFANVRREWRRELRSWYETDQWLVILAEAYLGLWGSASSRLPRKSRREP